MLNTDRVSKLNTLNLKAEPIVESLNDSEILNVTRRKNFQNPFFAYYNINSLRFKFEDLKEVLSNSLPDVLVLAETKLDKSFPNAQFFLSEYFEPTRKDFSCHSGGIIEYIRKGIIRKIGYINEAL